MQKLLNVYLKIIPVLSLVGIILSTLRTVFSSQLSFYILLVSAILDLIIIIYCYKLLRSRLIGFLILILILSTFVGLFNSNEISRHFITDFTNPLFFFCKIIIFSKYWRTSSFEMYIKYYSNIAFWGSLFLLPIVYFIFQSSGIKRLAIFPPLELPFSIYMQSGGLFFFVTLIMIVLYGKRSQLGSALVTFIVFIFIFKRKQFLKYLMLSIVLIIGINFLFSEYSDNLAIRRLTYTFNQFIDSENATEGVSAVSAGRDLEIETVLGLMDSPKDYFFGMGSGVSFNLNIFPKKELSNIHFSPLSFIFKYGIIFTVFIYGFLLRELFSIRKQNIDRMYLAAYGTLVFVFIESFFAYALFVTSILPVVIGYLNYKRKE